MAVEEDTPPQAKTWRRYVWDLTIGLRWLHNYFGRRFGGTIGLVSDMLSEGAQQAFYQTLPGHPQQAPDSLQQNGIDRDLFRFRGETDAYWQARVLAVWDDYEQAGTPPQLLRVVNQWGNAGWPLTWNNVLVTLTENGPELFGFRLTIPFGLINPPWVPEVYGGPIVYGEEGLYYGIGLSTDIPALLYLVRKWKGSRNRGHVRVFFGAGPSDYVEFIV